MKYERKERGQRSKSSEQGLTSAKDPPIEPPRDASPPTIDYTIYN